MSKKLQIYNIRNIQIILDSDLAEYFDIKTKVFNQTVKRHLSKFTEDSLFKPTKEEMEIIKNQIESNDNSVTSNDDFVTSKKGSGGRRYSPFVFSKQGVEILCKTLKKEIDIDALFNISKIVTKENLGSKIHNIRGVQVMLDFELAQLYQVETKVLNQAVKRNLNRFPSRFRFQINKEEMNELVTICDQFKTLKHSYNLPFVFTERGVAMLAAILQSEIAIDMSIQIMDAFVDNKKFINDNSNLFKRIGNIEEKLLENDSKFNKIFNTIESNENPLQGIFYDGEMFDAYALLSKIIRKAKKSMIIIDNYIDESTLLLFTKRNKNVKVTFYTKKITKILKQDLEKHNSQYPPVEIKKIYTSHDRFLILDNNKVYHFGASLKDLGKYWFAFSELQMDAQDILEKL